MAEVLGTISAVIAIAETSLKASSALHELFTTIKDAPREIMALDRDISVFKSLVISLQAALNLDDVIVVVERDHEIDALLDILLLPMKNCKELCEEIHKKLQSSGASLPSSGGPPDIEPARRFQLRFAKWHFMKKDVYSLLARFQASKGVFSDAMGTLTLIHSMISKDQPNNQVNGTQRFDDDAGSAFLRYTKISQDVHLDLSTMHLPAKRTKLRGPQHTKSLLDAVRNGEFASVEMMLGSIDVDTQDPQTGRTALSITAELGNLQMTKLLLTHGANVNIRQYSLSKPQGEGFEGCAIVRSGRFPLHWAVVGEHVDIVKLLLEHRANPNARNSAGRPVLQEAC
ncbi:hypothetical protein N7540_011244 [Penicillium herquei]|nr:hypothetical protein N7540_011244 [Penicillium herquei]